MTDNIQNISWPGWEVVKVIGRGSFGTVYEIQRDIFGDLEKAALKVISIPQDDSDIEEMYSDGLDEESITEHFQAHLKNIVKEYNLMQGLKGSTNVVQCEDIRYVQHDNGIGWDIYIKMELLTPMHKALSENVDEKTVEKIAKDICSALVLCKKHNVIHRDIKPQNIFVSPHGDYKLGDFGIAKTVEKTMGGTKTGTYKYMAPEVYNNQPYGSAVDIYSLGLVLYWLLNDRRLPFLPPYPEKVKAGMEEEARNRRLVGEALPPPSHGSDKLKKIVLKACAYNPKERYHSAEEMLDALNDKQTQQTPPPPPQEHTILLKTVDAASKLTISQQGIVDMRVNSDIPKALNASGGTVIKSSLGDELQLFLVSASNIKIEKIEIIGKSGQGYSGGLEYKRETGKYEMMMVDEDITISVYLKTDGSSGGGSSGGRGWGAFFQNKKQMAIAAAVVLALVVALATRLGGKDDHKPVQTTAPKSYATAKPVSTPKPTSKPKTYTTTVTSPPKSTTKPVSTPKPGLYSETEIQSMLSKLKDPPTNSELFNDYKQGYIASSKGFGVYGYSVHKVVVNGETVAKPIFTVSDGAEITIVGYNSGNDRYCVIVNSTDKACWVNADYVVKY